MKTRRSGRRTAAVAVALAAAVGVVSNSSPASAAPSLPVCGGTMRLQLDFDQDTGTDMYQDIAMCLARDGGNWRAAVINRGYNDKPSFGYVLLGAGYCGTATAFASSKPGGEQLLNATVTDWKPYWSMGPFCVSYTFQSEGGPQTKTYPFDLTPFNG